MRGAIMPELTKFANHRGCDMCNERCQFNGPVTTEDKRETERDTFYPCHNVRKAGIANNMAELQSVIDKQRERILR